MWKNNNRKKIKHCTLTFSLIYKQYKNVYLCVYVACVCAGNTSKKNN